MRHWGELRLIAAAIVAAALVLAIARPATLRFPMAVGASAVSVALSYAVSDGFGRRLLNRLGAWPGFTELAGLGLLTGWNVRVASPARATIAAAALATALWAQIVWRFPYSRSGELAWLAAALWFVVVGAGLYLRWLDARELLHAERARIDERIEIARELHDLVAHHVAGIVIQAQAAQLVADRQPGATVPALQRIELAGGEALTAMRAMVGALRHDGDAGERTPTASLRDLRDMAAASTPGHPAVDVSIDERANALSGVLAAALHRIAREAVVNARRHGVGTTRIDVRLTVNDNVAELRVDDHGSAAAGAPATTSGFGLLGMAERAAALGGTFAAGPRPTGDGWTVIATVPIDPGSVVTSPAAPR